MTYKSTQSQTKMAYKPPQARSQTTYRPPHRRNSTAEQKKQEPPAQVFAVAQPDAKPKEWVDHKLTNIFKNAKRHKKVRWGWVKLTPNGMVDSMTAEERELDDEDIQEKRTYETMLSLERRRQEYRDEKFERDGYLSDESVCGYDTDDDVDDADEEEEEELDDEELDMENRMYEDPVTKKWNSS
jgi:hypothetical protein